MASICGIELISNEELDSFQPGDNTIELTGVIVRLDPQKIRRNAVLSAKAPFRYILSNMTGRFVRVLFWPPKAKEFEGAVLHQIVKITRGKVMLSDPRYIRASDNLMNIEISVQSNTTVELLDPAMTENTELKSFPLINLKSAATKVGEFVGIEGYIKTTVANVTYGNSSYGSGAITDCYYRIPGYVSSFNEGTSPPKSTKVLVKGQLRRNEFNTLILQVTDMSHFEVLSKEIKSDIEMKNGFHAPPEPSQKRGHEFDENEDLNDSENWPAL